MFYKFIVQQFVSSHWSLIRISDNIQFIGPELKPSEFNVGGLIKTMLRSLSKFLFLLVLAVSITSVTES